MGLYNSFCPENVTKATVKCLQCGDEEVLPEKKKMRCGKCKKVARISAYCNRECQTQNWKEHKKTCGLNVEDLCPEDTKSVNASKAWLVPAGRWINEDKFAESLKPIKLNSYGNYSGELKEINDKFGWKKIAENKFYDRDEKGNFSWYYFVYSNERSAEESPLLSAVGSIKGPAVILKSGPAAHEESCSSYDENINRYELAKDVAFYHTNPRRKPKKVFQEREGKRMIPFMLGNK